MKPRAFTRRFTALQYIIAASHSLMVSWLVLFHKNTAADTLLSVISVSRLLVILLPFSVFLLALYSIRQIAVEKDVINILFREPSRMAGTQLLALAAVSLGLTGLCLPAYHFQDYAAYYVRIQPVLFWIGLCGLQLLLILFLRDPDGIRQKFKEKIVENRSLLRVSLVVISVFLITWLVIAKTGLGMTANGDYWYEAGVPILPLQIIVSALCGLLFERFEKRLGALHSPKAVQWIFVGIWLATALFWASTPVPNSYMNPSPLPPNHEAYPYSDAATYDLQSQYALIGQRLNNGKSVDNPLYPLLLVIIHLVSGQNYAANMALQAAVYAVLPALAYLLGRRLFGSGTGIAFAVMTIFRGYNSIALTSLLNLSSPKQMLTDFPTAIGAALAILTLLAVFDKKHDATTRAAWHGMSLGFAFLIRPTALALLAVSPAIGLFQKWSYGKWLRVLLLVIFGFIIFITPWGFRNGLHGNNPILVYLNKINLVKEERFPRVRNENPVSINPTPGQPADHYSTAASRKIDYKAALSAVTIHFFHNVEGSVLILPTSLKFDTLWQTVKSPGAVWQPDWRGALSIWQILTLFSSLAFLAFGIAAAWARNRAAGLIPLLAFLLYQGANSVGRTSGGRYIVPIDWVIVFYFAAGIMGVLSILLAQKEAAVMKTAVVETEAATLKKLLPHFGLILLLGITPVLLDFSLSSQRNFPEQADMAARISTLSNYSEQDILAFIQTKGAELVTGQAMYPRYFDYHAATRYIDNGLTVDEYPHLEFSLLGEDRANQIILYTQTETELKNATNVIVLGCRKKGDSAIQAIAVIASLPTGTIFIRDSNPPLACPLQAPVCNNNGVCN